MGRIILRPAGEGRIAVLFGYDPNLVEKIRSVAGRRFRVQGGKGQKDRYTLLSAVGRLSARVLGLHVPVYDAAVHYHQVRDSWVGVRVPDGK